MKKIFLQTVLGCLCLNGFSQGFLRGMISDENGETIVGANIYLKTDASVGTISDLDGKYSLNIPAGRQVTIVFSFISYRTIEETLTLESGEVRILNITMVPSTIELEDVIITGRSDRENDNYMKIKKINAPVSIDYISKETIRKTGDSYIDDAIQRVTGVSMVNGFITVRGLADRYIRTTVNGFKIPTLDPLTSNIKLDMFPTSMVDNIVISKTVSPDLPGDWSGSFLSIETKDYPDEFMFYAKTSFGYNPQSSFTDVITTETSPTDWLGFDNGFREGIRYDEQDFPAIDGITGPYDEFVALGLGSFLQQYGITEENLPKPPSNIQPTNMDEFFWDNIYFRMGLVELGLLVPGYIDDDNKVLEALDAYYNNPEMKPKAHMDINARTAEFGASLPDNWNYRKKKNYLSFSQDLAFGNQIKLFGKPMGFVAGFRYASSLQYDPNTTSGEGLYSQNPANFGEYVAWSDYRRQQSSEANQWNAIITGSCRFSPNHSMSFLFMPNVTGINSVKADSGYSQAAYAGYSHIRNFRVYQHYEERRQIIYQLSSKHYFPFPQLRLEFGASYTDGYRNTPDFKQLQYGRTEDNYEFRQGDKPARDFMSLDENVIEVHASGEFPFLQKPGLPRKIKIGGLFTQNKRQNDQTEYLVGGLAIFPSETSGELLDKLSIDAFSTYDPSVNSLGRYYTNAYRKTDHARGVGRVSAGYFMLDYSIVPRLRITGGLRTEHTFIYSDVSEFYNKGIPANDPERVEKFAGTAYQLIPSRIDTLNFLPSINLVYKLVNRNQMAMNLRASFSKTIGRPTVRETSAYLDFNYRLGKLVIGNPKLKMVSINNYDLRLETFFPSGDNVSLSVFYKEFENHIELQDQGFAYSWINAIGLSTAKGIELEGKKIFLRYFEIMGNVTLIKSQAIVEEIHTGGVVADTITRTMYGQAPYIINGILSYKSENGGFTASASYNVQGPKLVFVTRQGNQPDVFELPRHVVDLKIGKDFGKHFNLELKIRNLLKQRTIWAYNESDFAIEFEGYNYGTWYVMSIAYRF